MSLFICVFCSVSSETKNYHYTVSKSLFHSSLNLPITIALEEKTQTLVFSEEYTAADTVFDQYSALTDLWIEGTGGAISAHGSVLTLSNCNFTNNYAVYAGAVMMVSTSARIINCLFQGNHAINDVGALWSISMNYLYLSACNFTDNIAGGYYGAALLNHSLGPVEIDYCCFENCQSGISVAAIGMMSLANASIMNTVIANNSCLDKTSEASCAALWLQGFSEVDPTVVTISNTVFLNNTIDEQHENTIRTFDAVVINLTECNCFDTLIESAINAITGPLVLNSLGDSIYGVDRDSCFCRTGLISATEQFSISELFKLTAAISYSSDFQETNDFTITNLFSDSSAFQETNDFTITNLFSDSYNFQETNDFTITNIFSYSSDFQETNDFTITTIFSDSYDFQETNDFTITNIFSYSSDFQETNDFTITNLFSDSSAFQETNDFTITNLFSYSYGFQETNDFTITNIFSYSSDFQETNDITSMLHPFENSVSYTEEATSYTTPVDSSSQKEESNEELDTSLDFPFNMGGLGLGLGLLLLLILLILICCCCCRKRGCSLFNKCSRSKTVTKTKTIKYLHQLETSDRIFDGNDSYVVFANPGFRS